MKRFIKPKRNPRQTLLIIVIGGVLMICLDFAQTHLDKARPPLQQKPPTVPVAASMPKTATPSPVKIKDVQRLRNPAVIPEVKNTARSGFWESLVSPASKEVPEQKEETTLTGTPKIAIIIDDMGMDRRRTRQVIDLPAPLTLAFLPYAKHLPDITKEAAREGHELLMHVPMEPIGTPYDLGGMGLTVDMPEAAFNTRLKDILGTFEGYVGINNHMGSRLTQDQEAMSRVMRILKKRDLLFVDSKTINTSVASETAAAHGIRHTDRDVFLDHDTDLQAVRRNLKKLEATARRNGYSVGIGHPKDNTIQALQDWLPAARRKGFKIVPVSAVTQERAS